MHVVAGWSDRVVALDHGVKIAEGGFDQVANHPRSWRPTWGAIPGPWRGSMSEPSPKSC